VKKLKEFRKLLESKTFELKIRTLSYIISQLNTLTEKLQSHTFNIGALKTEMRICFKTLLRLITSSDTSDQSFDELLKIDWALSSNQTQHFLDSKEFIFRLKTHVHPSFDTLIEAESSAQEEFTEIFKNFLADILTNLIYYLPFDDDVVNSINFLELKGKSSILEEKIIKLNIIFRLVEEEELRTQVFPQLLRLREISSTQFMAEENDPTLELWDKISRNGQYSSLTKFFRLSQVLPTSSSDVEQAFSTLKLFKNTQRNRLSEKSLEGLMLMHQEYASKDILISKRTLQLFSEVRSSLNERKKESSLPIRRSYSTYQEQNERDLDSFSPTIHAFKNEIITQELKKFKTNQFESQNTHKDLSDVEKEQVNEEEVMEINYTK